MQWSAGMEPWICYIKCKDGTIRRAFVDADSLETAKSAYLGANTFIVAEPCRLAPSPLADRPLYSSFPAWHDLAVARVKLLLGQGSQSPQQEQRRKGKYTLAQDWYEKADKAALSKDAWEATLAACKGQ
jgi:hypothetical protein